MMSNAAQPFGTDARYAGIDLAAEPARTGVALLREDHAGHLLVEQAWLGADDEALCEVLDAAAKTGVDVPFGWPRLFVEHVHAHAAGTSVAPADSGRDWRRSMALRRTDLVVWERAGVLPLSVATDKIAYPALRWSALEARLRDAGVDCPRDGAGRACEVYPASALKIWGLAYRGYKKDVNAERRKVLLEQLQECFPQLDFNGHAGACIQSDDVLDAVISALVAREVAHGRTPRPGVDEREDALVEGWIHVPAVG